MTTLAKKMDTKNKQTDKRKSDETIIRVGTWNVRGIYGEGEIESLEREANKYSMELIALQETHISDTATTSVGEYMLFTSGGETRRYGVGFLVSNTLKEKVKRFVPVSDRLC